jgi:CheY-like chemotaxis protein
MENIKIMIVEDEFIIARNLKMMLEDLGYKPYDPVDTVKDAIHLLENNHVDMAILDINLSGAHEGIEIGNHINTHIHIPFIYLTSNADKATVDEAKLTHPNAYLIKPFSSDDIYAAIETAISTQNVLDKDEELLNILSDTFFIKLDRKYYKVDIKDISHFEADGKGIVGNIKCGDQMLVMIKVNAKNNTIADCRWKTYGCASAIAATSMLSVMVTEKKGMKIDEALKRKGRCRINYEFDLLKMDRIEKIMTSRL